MSPDSKRRHARLSPSSAHRWMNCPGSVELCKDIPDLPSRFAGEGTAAHLLAEACLRNSAYAQHYLGWFADLPLRRLGLAREAVASESFRITSEMVEAVQIYIDAVQAVSNEGARIAVETPVDLSWIPGLEGGTIDATVCGNGELHIFDLKYGAGVAVEVQDNPQLMLYAAGVMESVEGAKSVRTTVVQPRCPHPGGAVRSATYSTFDVYDFALEVMIAAEKTLEPDAPLNPGDWCRFCPARAKCPALRAEVALAGSEIFGELAPPEPKIFSPGLLADFLGKARLLKTWIEAIEAHAHAEALAGRVPPGFKLVARRARRRWAVSYDEVLEKVSEFGLTTDDICETNLISPAAMDKLLKKDKAAIKPFVIAVSSGVDLVPESDPRPVARLSAAEAFQIERETILL